MVSASSTDTFTNKTLTSPQIGTSIIPSSADGATIGSASAEFSDLFWLMVQQFNLVMIKTL